jgi:glycosyltransferase involved in cell wall biosynthesis
MKLSVVTPVYNESKNLPELHKQLTEVLSSLPYPYEIIATDDKSKDDSGAVLDRLAAKDARLKVIHFRANRGQTAALQAAIDHANGEVIIAIDSDLENDPKDIPKLLKRLDEGYDIVSGWRSGRWHDQKLARRIPSMTANLLISRMTGVKLHDHGCTLKVYRREVFDDVRLYGEMHRFIAAYLARGGASIAEEEVNHRPRIHGKSNYGMSRVFRVLLDLVLVKFLNRYMNRPLHFFGGLGFVSLALGSIAFFAAVVLKFIGLRSFVATPLPVFSALLIIVGVLLVVMGILAEMIMRVYYEGQNKRTYIIRSKTNFTV